MSNITFKFYVLILYHFYIFYSRLKFCHCQQEHGPELQQSVNLQRQEYVQGICDLYTKRTRKSLEDLSEKDLEHVLVDRRRKLVYCYVPKVACTNWKRVLLYLTYKDNVDTNSKLYQKLSKYNITDVESIPAKLVHENGVFENLGQIKDVEERSRIVNEFTRFVMVRHPFDRLLSAYRNKLQGDSASALYFQARIGRYIVKNFRKNPTKDSLQRGHDVTFREFCEYLISIDSRPKTNSLFNNDIKKVVKLAKPKLNFNTITEKLLNELFFDESESSSMNNSRSSPEVFNEHWMPTFDLCHPCVIKYNVIGKYETLTDDARLLLSLIDPENRVRFPQSITHYYDKNTNTTTTSSSPSPVPIVTNNISSSSTSFNYLSSSSQTIMSSPRKKDRLSRALSTLSVDMLEKLYRVYENDFKIFGYGLENLLGYEIA